MEFVSLEGKDHIIVKMKHEDVAVICSTLLAAYNGSTMTSIKDLLRPIMKEICEVMDAAVDEKEKKEESEAKK